MVAHQHRAGGSHHKATAHKHTSVAHHTTTAHKHTTTTHHKRHTHKHASTATHRVTHLHVHTSHAKQDRWYIG
jgi:hypothetical protein